MRNVLLFTVCILVFLTVCTATPTVLYVGALMELTENWYSSYTPLFVTVIKHAMEDIHQREDILTDFRFELIVMDTKGEPGLAAIQTMRLAKDDPPKVAIIGPNFSKSLTITGQIVPFYHLIEMSSIATTSTTVDRSLFPTLFKVNQVSETLNPIRIKVMKHFGWTRVGTIAFQHDIDVSQMNSFHEMLYENNMTLVTSAIVSKPSSITSVITAFKQFNVRIITASISGDIARKVFCEAYRVGLYGASYVWILSNPTLHTTWREDHLEDDKCSTEQIKIATNGVFTLDHQKNGHPNSTIISGKTPIEGLDEIKELADNSSYKMSRYSGWVYDTVWALALGLNDSQQYLKAKGLSLHNYTNNEDYLNGILHGMQHVKFNGISGPVSFDETGSRLGVTYMEQICEDTKTYVLSYDMVEDILNWDVPELSIWKDGRVPRDRFVYRRVLAGKSKIAAVCVITSDIIGFVLSTGFLLFNIYFRNHRAVKMSSPLVNHAILVGCMMMYAEVFISSIEYMDIMNAANDWRLCTVRVWLLSVGFTSLFGSLFTKTYRVYKLFRETKVTQKFIKDKHLFGMIGVMFIIDAFILVPWSIFYPYNKQELVKSSKDTRDNNVINDVVYTYCSNSHQVYWLGVIYIYKGLLLAFGTFLAWETRNVSIPELNDSKYIGACIYNVVVVCLFGVPLVHYLPTEQVTLAYTLESFLLTFCTTICQCIIFIPRIQGRNKVFDRMGLSKPNTTTNKTVTANTTNSARGSDLDKSNNSGANEELEKENKNLRMKIANETVAIAKLRKQLLDMTGNVHFYKSGTDYVLFKRGGNMNIQDVTIENVESNM